MGRKIPYKARRERCAWHFKIDEVLSAADLPAYREVIERAGTTVDSALRWLKERGYAVSRSAVARHRRKHLVGKRDGERAAAANAVIREEFKDFKSAELGRVLLLALSTTAIRRMYVGPAEEISLTELAEIAQVVKGVMACERKLHAPQMDTDGRGCKAGKKMARGKVDPGPVVPGETVEDRVRRILEEPGRGWGL